MASEDSNRVREHKKKVRSKSEEKQRSNTSQRTSEERQPSVGQLFTGRKISVEVGQRNLFSKTSRTNYDDVLPSDNWTSTQVDQPVRLQMGERELGQKPITIMSVLRLNVEKYPDRKAYAYKSDGVWQYITYKGLWEVIRRAAKGLISFGMQRYSGVAIMGQNAPEWVIANFATIYAGGIVVPIATTLSADECCNIILNTSCSVIVVGSLKYLEKIAQIRHQLLYIKAIIKYGTDDDAKVIPYHTWNQLLAMGDKVHDERLKERMQFQAPNLCCAVVHTPGATGTAKPVMLSQDNFIWTARTLGRRLSCNVASGVIMVTLGFAHIVPLIMNLYVPTLFASTVYFISSPNYFEVAREVLPTTLYAPNLIFEELRLKLKSHTSRSYFSRLIFWWAKSVGFRGHRASINRRPRPICWSLANALVYHDIRTKLGLQNTREIFMSGRLISTKVLEFFASLDIPVSVNYGLTENTGPVTVSSFPDMFRISSVGKDMDGCSSKVMHPDKNGVGELRTRGRNVFMGYLNQPEKTKAMFDKDGWLMTGDLCRRDENGFLYVIGKIADLVTLQNGDKIHPAPIELRVKETLPFIRFCVLVGKGRPYLAMLLTIKTVVNWQTFEVSNVLTPDAREWFIQMGYKSETIDQFLQKPDKKILNKIQAMIDRLNKTTEKPSHRIQKWTILPKDLCVHDGELTWTTLLRRFYIEEKYAQTIDSMYIEK